MLARMLRLLARSSTAILLLAPMACSTKDPPAPDPAASARAAGSSSSTPATPASATATPTATASADAVSHASPPYEPGPSVLGSGSVDGAALRARHVERMKADSSPVTRWRTMAP